MTSIESKLDSLLDVYRQVLQKGPSALALSTLPLFELDHHQHHSSDYQTSCQRGESMGGVGGGGGGNGTKLPRGLRLILAPTTDDDLPPDSAPPSYPPSTASLTPSPLLPPDSPYPSLTTPNGTSKRAHFPDFPPPPPSSTAGFTLQLPLPMHPGRPRRPASNLEEDAGHDDDDEREEDEEEGRALCPSVVLECDGDDRGSGVTEANPAPGSVQRRGRGTAPELKDKSAWRRHLSLEVNSVLLLSSSSPEEQTSPSSDWGCGRGKSLSAHNLSLPSPAAAAPRVPTLSSALSNSSSSQGSSRGGGAGRLQASARHDVNNWGETELFIGECKLGPPDERFGFLGQGANFLSLPSEPATSSSDLLRTDEEEGSTSSVESLSQPPHIELT